MTSQSRPLTHEDVILASFTIKDHVQHPRLTQCDWMSSAVPGCGTVYVQNEVIQHTGSFKERGVVNALKSLSAEQSKLGVVAASAGNHALALCFHGQARLGIPTVVVMPTIAPMAKISRCRRLGAEVHVHGATIAESKQYAQEIATARNLRYINGYNDREIIAGAGTIGLEMLDSGKPIDAILVPVGGGGLVAGISLSKGVLSNGRRVRVVGVEPSACASMSAALRAGEPVRVEPRATLCDGLAVPMVGAASFEVARQHMDMIVTVPERFVALAMLRLVEEEKVIVEGAGAIGVAALLGKCVPGVHELCNIAITLCGGNIDTSVLGRVLERGLATDGRLCQLRAIVSDAPGGLAGLMALVAKLGASVREVVHERLHMIDDISRVAITFVAETRDHDHIGELVRGLEDAGYRPVRLQALPDTGVTEEIGVLYNHGGGVWKETPPPGSEPFFGSSAAPPAAQQQSLAPLAAWVPPVPDEAQRAQAPSGGRKRSRSSAAKK